MTEFYTKERSRIIHRDAGCRSFNRYTADSFEAAIRRGEIIVLRSIDPLLKRCGYCFSKAGYRRFPG